jgi:hypothetical protein
MYRILPARPQILTAWVPRGAHGSGSGDLDAGGQGSTPDATNRGMGGGIRFCGAFRALGSDSRGTGDSSSGLTDDARGGPTTCATSLGIHGGGPIRR